MPVTLHILNARPDAAAVLVDENYDQVRRALIARKGSLVPLELTSSMDRHCSSQLARLRGPPRQSRPKSTSMLATRQSERTADVRASTIGFTCSEPPRTSTSTCRKPGTPLTSRLLTLIRMPLRARPR